VAGTREAVTALQLDTKIDGLPAEVLAQALHQARDARLTILDLIERVIPEPRQEVSDNAPKIVSFEIPIDRIGEVIGPKGKVINALQAETGTDITVDDNGLAGTVTIGAKDGGAVAEAQRRISLIIEPPDADVGATYLGKVVNITKFGAFVNILPGRDGLLHISKVGGGKRVDRVEDVLSLGQEIEVRVDDIDPQGKVSLSLAGQAPASNEEDDNGSGSDRSGPSGDQRPARAPSFEEAFEAELVGELGDLGPGPAVEGRGDRPDRDNRDRGARRRPRRR